MIVNYPNDLKAFARSERLQCCAVAIGKELLVQMALTREEVTALLEITNAIEMAHKGRVTIATRQLQEIVDGVPVAFVTPPIPGIEPVAPPTPAATITPSANGHAKKKKPKKKPARVK